MPLIPRRQLAALAFAYACVAPAAAEVNAHLTIASDYIHRGLLLTADNPALQAGVDLQHDSGFFTGVFATTLDVRTGLAGRDREVDWYAGFYREFARDLSVTLTGLRYSYPGAGGSHDYDYTEAVADLAWRGLVTVRAAYTNDIFNLDVPSRHLQVTGVWPLSRRWEISGTAGRTDYGALGPNAFRHYDVGVSLLYSRVSADLRYYDSERPDEGIVGTLAAGKRFVVSLTVTF